MSALEVLFISFAESKVYITSRYLDLLQYIFGHQAKMESGSFQLEKGGRKIPKPLLNYNYYLNDLNTTQISIGYDAFTFKPCIMLVSLVDKKYINITPDNWKFVIECFSSAIDYLNEIQDTFDVRHSDDNYLHVQSHDLDPEDRFISLHDGNYTMYFNLIEIELLLKLKHFLSLMITHLDNRWYYVAEFYRAYLFKCFARNVNYLHEKQFFKLETSYVNYLRLFHEIPVLCADKLKYDLIDMSCGNI